MGDFRMQFFFSSLWSTRKIIINRWNEIFYIRERSSERNLVAHVQTRNGEWRKGGQIQTHFIYKYVNKNKTPIDRTSRKQTCTTKTKLENYMFVLLAKYKSFIRASIAKLRIKCAMFSKSYLRAIHRIMCTVVSTRRDHFFSLSVCTWTLHEILAL